MFKKYNIGGESNPYWQLAEPMLYKIWANGMSVASYSKLHFIHLLGLLFSVFTFVMGILLRISIVALILLVLYIFFKQPLLIAFNSILTPPYIGTTLQKSVDTNSLWLYELLGYVILVMGIVFVFGKNVTDFIVEVTIYILMIITNMFLLKWIASGLKNGNYFAQLAAKTSFMGTHIVQTIGAAPQEIVNEWDKIFDLYMNSNHENARRELEILSEAYSKDLEVGNV